jgi:hypothetical protein
MRACPARLLRIDDQRSINLDAIAVGQHAVESRQPTVNANPQDSEVDSITIG